MQPNKVLMHTLSDETIETKTELGVTKYIVSQEQDSSSFDMIVNTEQLKKESILI